MIERFIKKRKVIDKVTGMEFDLIVFKVFIWNDEWSFCCRSIRRKLNKVWRR